MRADQVGVKPRRDGGSLLSLPSFLPSSLTSAVFHLNNTCGPRKSSQRRMPGGASSMGTFSERLNKLLRGQECIVRAADAFSVDILALKHFDPARPAAQDFLEITPKYWRREERGGQTWFIRQGLNGFYETAWFFLHCQKKKMHGFNHNGQSLFKVGL